MWNTVDACPGTTVGADTRGGVSGDGSERATAAGATWGGRAERAPPRPLPDLPDALADEPEAWEARAGLAPRWPANERRFLRRCREEFAEAFAKAPPWPDVYGDRRLLRILRMDPARDEDLAVSKVAAYLAWRDETGAYAWRARVPEVGHAPRDWPHGERKPIHFAPLRWQLPFHLLDGILYPMSRKCTAAWHEGPEAQQLLGQITEAVDEGARDFSVQRAPHFVLLQRPFYDARLRPLLTHWALLWLRRNRVQHGSDEQIAAYIGRDPDADGSGTVLADGSLGGKPEMSRDEPRLSRD